MRYGIKYATVSLVLVVAMLLSPVTPLMRAQQASTQWAQWAEVSLARAEAAGQSSLYLPLIHTAVGPPSFAISQPDDGAVIGGMLYVAAQPLNPASVESVTFLAGSTTLGTDTTPADGYRVFLDASTLAAGPLTLTARATGKGGTAEQTIGVTVVPAPPASTTVGESGAVLATEIGSVLTIPPGGLPAGAAISASERTQEQVTAEHGIEWEEMGVTFLGAQELQLPASLSQPLGVASADFGNRVQPGQVVVNYGIFPDADGDGADELVVLNTASVAPNNDVISDPIPQVALGEPSTPFQPAAFTTQGEGTVSGPPGTMLELPATGLNANSAMSNIAVFRSGVDGTEVEMPATVTNQPSGNLDQTLLAMIPPLPTGPATLTVVNASTGASMGPIALEVTASAPLPRPREEIISDALNRVLTVTTDLRAQAQAAGEAEVVAELDTALRQTNALMGMLDEANTNPETSEALDTAALLLQNSGILTLPTDPTATAAQGNICSTSTTNTLVVVGAMGGIVLGVGTIVLGLSLISGGSFFLATFAAVWMGSGSGVLGGSILSGLYIALTCSNQPIICPGTPGPSLQGPPGGSNLRAGGTSPMTTGMGSAFLPGGEACGNAPTPPGAPPLTMQGTQPSGPYPSMAGRVTVRVFTPVGNIPFSAVTDAGGYFYLPTLPADQPFTAVAYDALTGRTETVEGVGPPLGEATTFNFDFFSPDEGGPGAIDFGEVVTGTIETGNETDAYTFMGSDDQWVLIRALELGDSPFRPKVSIYGPDNALRCTLSSLHLTINNCRLGQDGLHTVLVEDDLGTNTGDYRLYLERPDQIAGSTPINVGAVMSGTAPIVPAVDSYTTSSTAGGMLIRILSLSTPGSVNDVGLYNAGGNSTCLGSLGGTTGGPFLETLCPLQQSGEADYSVLIGHLTDFAPYRLYTQRTHDPVNATPITLNTAVSGTIAIAPEAVTYTFTGAEGDEVLVTMTETGTGGSIAVPYLAIYSPDGWEICSQSSAANAVQLTCTLDPRGTSGQQYTLIASDRRGTGTGTFDLTFAPAPP